MLQYFWEHLEHYLPYSPTNAISKLTYAPQTFKDVELIFLFLNIFIEHFVEH